MYVIQSRPDRDRYVKVVTQNIEAASLDQFVKREENETTSLGYAYDYHSIMHYGNNYYSTSDARTLVVYYCYFNIWGTLLQWIADSRSHQAARVRVLPAHYHITHHSSSALGKLGSLAWCSLNRFVARCSRQMHQYWLKTYCI